jgi:hypothetical protein
MTPSSPTDTRRLFAQGRAIHDGLTRGIEGAVPGIAAVLGLVSAWGDGTSVPRPLPAWAQRPFVGGVSLFLSRFGDNVVAQELACR